MLNRLTAVLLVALLLPHTGNDPSDDGGVGGIGIITGTDGSEVSVTGTKTTPGSSDSTDNRSDPGSKTLTPLEKCDITPTTVEFCPTAPARNGVGVVPDVTLTDLAQFAPSPTTLSAEPSNAGIAHMPTNFLGAASVHTQTGSLFDTPITVRFTPAGYDYAYGDGTSATVTAAGRTWEQLGLAQFTPTPTSHVYTERGTYTATLSIRYTAEIDLGRGWRPVSGQLTVPAPAQQIQIFEARTALVAHTCTERPTAPGC
jgi:hypothetical protein